MSTLRRILGGNPIGGNGVTVTTVEPSTADAPADAEQTPSRVEPGSSVGAAGPHASVPAEPQQQQEFVHNPLYDHLTADKQLTAEERAQGYIAEWNGLHKVKVEPHQPKSVEQVRALLAEAAKRGKRVSVSGARHSSGGQSISANSVHLDMTQMRGAKYNADRGTVSVKAGTNWLDVMDHLEKYGQSVAVKQEFANFTVGGSVSVNAMGRDWRFGPVGNTVKSLDVMLASGEVVHASREENAELFEHVIGGLGMFGVVLEVELETVPNQRYEQNFETKSLDEFDAHFREHVASDEEHAHIFNGQLSTAPGSFMEQVEVNTWRSVSGEAPADFRPEDTHKVRTWLKRQMLNASRIGGPLGKKAFWWASQNLVPLTSSKHSVRNDALAPAYNVFKPSTPRQTEAGGVKGAAAKLDEVLFNEHAQALDVSIVPRDQLPAFRKAVDAIQTEMGTNVFVATIYPVKEDHSAALKGVKKDSYVITLGIDFKRTDEDIEAAKEFYRRVAQAAMNLGGRMYLSHQLDFPMEQLLAKDAYPEIPAVLEAKQNYDSSGRFDNVLVDKYRQYRAGEVE